MPVMDGWEATKHSRQPPAGDRIRIIARTAQAMAGDRRVNGPRRWVRSST